MENEDKRREVHHRVLGKFEAAMEGEPTDYAVEALIYYLAKLTVTHMSFSNIDEQANDVVKFYYDAVQKLKVNMLTQTWDHTKN